MLFIAAVQLAALGVMGDILAGSRVLSSASSSACGASSCKLGVEPSHYEPGNPPATEASNRDAERAADEQPTAEREAVQL